jgi:uncharacterized protein DUF397
MKIERKREWRAGVWLKSSRSYGAGNCVEVRAVEGGIKIRDSKSPDEPHLSLSRAEWAAFLAGVRNGEFDQV